MKRLISFTVTFLLISCFVLAMGRNGEVDLDTVYEMTQSRDRLDRQQALAYAMDFLQSASLSHFVNIENSCSSQSYSAQELETMAREYADVTLIKESTTGIYYNFDDFLNCFYSNRLRMEIGIPSIMYYKADNPCDNESTLLELYPEEAEELRTGIVEAIDISKLAELEERYPEDVSRMRGLDMPDYDILSSLIDYYPEERANIMKTVTLSDREIAEALADRHPPTCIPPTTDYLFLMKTHPKSVEANLVPPKIYRFEFKPVSSNKKEIYVYWAEEESEMTFQVGNSNGWHKTKFQKGLYVVYYHQYKGNRYSSKRHSLADIFVFKAGEDFSDVYIYKPGRDWYDAEIPTWVNPNPEANIKAISASTPFGLWTFARQGDNNLRHKVICERNR